MKKIKYFACFHVLKYHFSHDIIIHIKSANVKLEVNKLELDFEISEEQAEQFARDLYYGSDFVAEVKKCIADNPEAFAKFQEERRKHNGE